MKFEPTTETITTLNLLLNVAGIAIMEMIRRLLAERLARSKREEARARRRRAGSTPATKKATKQSAAKLAAKRKKPSAQTKPDTDN